jgi:hypothetical protein
MQEDVWQDKHEWQNKIINAIDTSYIKPTNTIIKTSEKYSYDYVIKYNTYYEEQYAFLERSYDNIINGIDPKYRQQATKQKILETALMGYWSRTHAINMDKV